MKQNPVSRYFILGSTLLLILVLLLSLMLNINTFRKNYEDVITSTISILADEDVRQIEYAMKYGKEIDNFSGMDKKLETFLKWREDIIEVNIYAFDGEIYYKHGKTNKQYLTQAIILEYFFQFKPDEQVKSINHGNEMHISLPIHSADGAIVGGILVVVDSSNLNKEMKIFLVDNQFYIGVIGILSGLLILVLIIRKPLTNQRGEFNKKGLTRAVIIALLFSQLIYAGVTIYHFNNVYKENALSNAHTITQRVTGEISRLLSIGLRMEDLGGASEWLNEINETASVIDHIEINEIDAVFSTDSETSVFEKLVLENGEVVGRVDTQVSEEYLRKAIGTLFLNSLSVLAISILLFVELIKFIIGLIEKTVVDYNEEQKALNDIGMIRFVTFFLLFSVGLSISFIPIISRQLYNPALGISEGISTALPVQAEMLFTSIFAIISGYISSKKGWRVSFFAGATMLCIGAFISGIASEIWLFIMARAFVGIGYGLSWTSVTAFAGNWKDERLRTRGIGEVIAGIYAGSNCGVAIGAMMADYTSYNMVFNLTVIATIFSMLLAAVFVKNKIFEQGAQETISTMDFLKDFKVSAFLIVIVVPAMVMAMFLAYFVPLYGREIDLSQSNIGQLFLLNGLMIVYLGPFIVDQLTAKFKSKRLIIISGLLRVVAIGLFAIRPGVVTLIIAIVILSVVDSFAMTVNSSYLLSLEICEKFGRDKALGIISVFRKIGSLLGPTIFNFAFIIGVSKTMYGIIGVYLVLMSVFLITLYRSKGESDGTGIGA